MKFFANSTLLVMSVLFFGALYVNQLTLILMPLISIDIHYLWYWAFISLTTGIILALEQFLSIKRYERQRKNLNFH